MSILAWCLSLVFVTAPPGDDVTYTVNSRRFMIPIYIRSHVERDKIDSLILYSSSDKGKTWREVTKTSPKQTYFRFSAPGDGIYWFAVQVIYKNHTKEPSIMDNAEPNLKVGVATMSNVMRKAEQQDKLGGEVNHLREKVEKLEKRIDELEKQHPTKQ